MKILIKKIKEYPSAIFAIFDVFIIAFSALLAFLLRFDGKIPAEKLNNFYSFIILAIFLTIPVFFLKGIYKISWKYVSLTDLPNILGAAIISWAVLGGALFILRGHYLFEGFPRSIIFIYAILLFLFTGGLRFSKRIYWQLIRSKGMLFEEKISSTLTLSKEDEPKTVLITGGAGYIGSVLSSKLLKGGYTVRVIDKLLFGNDSIKGLKGYSNFQFIKGDFLDTNELAKILVDVDSVIHLAAIVGEAACVAKKDLAIKTNYLGTVHLARLCKFYGIKRFIYASTCSAYGESHEDVIKEDASFEKPVDFYGETKIYAEKEIIRLIDENFAPTILRFSTVYGLSPRMRFDLVVNSLAKKAVANGEIIIFGGKQWRPLIHIDDLARAILLVLQAPLSKVGNQIFNVGDNNENYTIHRVGELVKECIPRVKIKTIKTIDDKRNYRVSFDKIEKILQFKCNKTVKDGIVEIYEAIKNDYFDDLEDKKYYNHLV